MAGGSADGKSVGGAAVGSAGGALVGVAGSFAPPGSRGTNTSDEAAGDGAGGMLPVAATVGAGGKAAVAGAIGDAVLQATRQSSARARSRCRGMGVSIARPGSWRIWLSAAAYRGNIHRFRRLHRFLRR